MVPTIKYLVFSFSRHYQQVSWYRHVVHHKMTDSIRTLIPMATYLGKSGTNYLIEIFTKYSTNDDILKPKREKPFKKTIPNTGYI